MLAARKRSISRYHKRQELMVTVSCAVSFAPSMRSMVVSILLLYTAPHSTRMPAPSSFICPFSTPKSAFFIALSVRTYVRTYDKNWSLYQVGVVCTCLPRDTFVCRQVAVLAARKYFPPVKGRNSWDVCGRSSNAHRFNL